MLVRFIVRLWLRILVLRRRSSSLVLRRLSCVSVHVAMPTMLWCLHPSALLVIVPVTPLLVAALVVAVIVVLLVVLAVVSHVLLLLCGPLVVVVLLRALWVAVVLLLLVCHGGAIDAQATDASNGEASESTLKRPL